MALTRSLKVYNGSDAVPVTDVTDRTDWPQTELSTMANVGDAAAGQWLMRDEGGTIPDFVGSGELIDSHNVVVALVGSNTLWRGRLAADDHYRGRQKAARAKEINFTVEDQNSHLRGIVVHNWVRGAEYDWARAQALVATYLSGTPRATTNLNGSNLVISSSNSVMLPAKTYSGVTPYEVMQELASNADKEMFVTVDNELAYFGHDYTGYASLLRISDLGYPGGADESSTTYVPKEPHGAEIGRNKLSALRSYYGTDTTEASVRVTNANAPRFDYWEDLYWDSESTTAAQAAARAQKMLDFRSVDDVNYSCTIGPMPGDDIWKIKPGQQILFKSRAARGGRNANGSYIADTFLTTRVRQINWTMPDPDRYFARLELEKPKQSKTPSKGSQALATAPKPAPTIQPDTINSPTTIYSFLYTTDNKDEATHTLSGGLDRTTPGAPGSWPTASGYLGAAYGFNDAGAFLSEKLPISANTQYSIREKFIFRFTPANRDTYIRWLDVGGGTIREDLFIDGSDYAIGVGYEKSILLTSPSNATDLRIRYSNFAGFFADDVYIETPGSVVAADNDPEAVVDGGDSPFYMRSDDPRVIGLLDDMARVGFSWKTPVRAATTAAGTLASSFENGDTVDGVVLATGDRILIKDQAAGEANGIYVVAASGAPTRAEDFDSDDKVLGAAAFVSEGTANGNKVFVCTTNAPIELDATALVFAQVSGGGDVSTDAIWDAAGDLAVGTGANTAGRLAIGASNSHLVSDGATALWVPQALATGGDSAKASGTGDVTITGSLQDLTGATLSLGPGTYIVAGTFDVIVNNSSNDRTFEGHLDVGGVDQNDIAILLGVGLDNLDRQTLTQFWRVSFGTTTTVKLRGKYSGGATGDFTAKADNTTISAWAAGGSHGDWTAYTPSLTATTTNPTIGNGTILGRYKMLDTKTVLVGILFVFGSTSNAGSGSWRFSLPSGMTTKNVGSWKQTLQGTLQDSGTTNQVIIARFEPNDTKCFEMVFADGANPHLITHVAPMTWATNDFITLGPGVIELE